MSRTPQGVSGCADSVDMVCAVGGGARRNVSMWRRVAAVCLVAVVAAGCGGDDDTSEASSLGGLITTTSGASSTTTSPPTTTPPTTTTEAPADEVPGVRTRPPTSVLSSSMPADLSVSAPGPVPPLVESWLLVPTGSEAIDWSGGDPAGPFSVTFEAPQTTDETIEFYRALTGESGAPWSDAAGWATHIFVVLIDDDGDSWRANYEVLVDERSLSDLAEVTVTVTPPPG